MMRVYVVDDDEQVRAALLRLLQSAGHEAQGFASAAQCLQALQPDAAACLVLDLAMPGLDGLQLQHLLCQRAPELPVVFLTGRGDIAASVKAMKHGATDFLTKPVDDAVLLDAVAEALAEAERRRGLKQRSADLARHLDALTARERQVLELVLAGRLNKQIAAELGTSEKTVKFHRGNLMHKMGVRSVAELARWVANAGPSPSGTKVQ
ncbi:MAG TPA: response regulator [Burkholderiaceae bacterium]|nr:response regulator [Burkholderiaceae bacterium]